MEVAQSEEALAHVVHLSECLLHGEFAPDLILNRSEHLHLLSFQIYLTLDLTTSCQYVMGHALHDGWCSVASVILFLGRSNLFVLHLFVCVSCPETS